MSDDRALLDKFVESKNVFNPDILDCIANLSNDEVFTPPKLVNEVLDTLPPEIWHDSKITFLDPACKSGVWLREVTKRLINGLADEIPDLQERIDHILHKQVFGIAITELTSLLSRRSLYCSKYPNGRYSISRFDDVSGNIWYQNIDHKWKNGRCALCGANQSEYDRSEDKNSYAYGFIHLDPHYWEEVFGVKFDVIIGNPPYQLGAGGYGAQATPIYNKFVEVAKELNPKFICMIIPARWFAGGMGLNGFRKDMISDRRMKELVDFPSTKDAFVGVDIKGGVCYFLWSARHNGGCAVRTIVGGNVVSSSVRLLDEFGDIFVRSNEAVNILHKVLKLEEKMVSSIASAINPFNIPTNFKGFSARKSTSVKIYARGKTGWVDPDQVSTGVNYLNSFKVLIAIAAEGGGDIPNGVLGKPIVAPPNSVCTMTYMVVGVYNNEATANNLASYLKTKFARFMVFQRKTTQHVSRGSFDYLPMQDFRESWTDDMLYSKYGLTQDEIDYIESTIKEMK